MSEFDVSLCPPFPEVAGVRFAHVPEYPGYAASDDGAIWCCKPRHRWGGFVPWWKMSLRMKRERDGRKRYLFVTINHEGAKRPINVHTLVLLAFAGPKPPGMECRHFPDPTKTNNKASNLRWGTRRENMLDQVKDGTNFFANEHKLRKAATQCQTATETTTASKDTPAQIVATTSVSGLA